MKAVRRRVKVGGVSDFEKEIRMADRAGERLRAAAGAARTASPSFGVLGEIRWLMFQGTDFVVRIWAADHSSADRAPYRVTGYGDGWVRLRLADDGKHDVWHNLAHIETLRIEVR